MIERRLAMFIGTKGSIYNHAVVSESIMRGLWSYIAPYTWNGIVRCFISCGVWPHQLPRFVMKPERHQPMVPAPAKRNA